MMATEDSHSTDETNRPRILVVEDDADMRKLLVSTLATRGYSVDEADSASAAMKLSEAGRHVLAIVDIRLPDLDGCELVDKIRERLGDSAPPAILLSVYVDREYEKLGPGVVGALPKAFSLDRLLELVAEHAPLSRPN